MYVRRRVYTRRRSIKPEPPKCNYKKGWWRNNWPNVTMAILSLLVSATAIFLSCYFAKQADLSSKQIKKVTDADLFMGIKGYTDRMGFDISKMDDPLFFYEVFRADLRGDKLKIRESLAEYIEIEPGCGIAYWLVGKYFSDKDTIIPDNSDSAVHFYSLAINHMENTDINKPIAYISRGEIKVDYEKYKEAIADCDSAIELRKDYALAYYNRGVAKWKSKEYSTEEAIADYDRAIKLKPDFADAFYNRGIAKYKLEDYLGAIADFNRAIELKPNYAEAKRNIEIAKRKLEEQKTNPSGGEDSSE